MLYRLDYWLYQRGPRKFVMLHDDFYVRQNLKLYFVDTNFVRCRQIGSAQVSNYETTELLNLFVA